jgi:tyrosine-protein phosphatase YwqE
MSIFNRKKSFLTSGLLLESADNHSHILPGVDDGIANYDAAVEALQWLYGAGVRRLLMTPHVMSDYLSNNRQFLIEAFNNFKKKLDNNGVKSIPELNLAAEYMLECSFNKHITEPLLTFDNNHVLIETSYLTPPIGMTDIIDQLIETGYLPVIAHPERYKYMDEDDYKLFINKGVKYQLNYLSLSGLYGETACRKSDILLRKGYYSFVGSDFHNLKRHQDACACKCLNNSQIELLKPLFISIKN